MNVRPALPNDASAIRDVARTTWHATYADIYSRQFIDAFLDQNYSVESLTQAIERVRGDAFHRFDVAIDPMDVVVGFLHLGRLRGSMPWVARLYILPSHQRRGIGATLLTDLEAHLRRFGETRYGLHVHGRNTLGLAFYQKHGFVHRPDLDDGDEWHMEKTLS